MNNAHRISVGKAARCTMFEKPSRSSEVIEVDIKEMAITCVKKM
jgi:hypothetical protein